MHWLDILTLVTAGGLFLGLAFFAITSWREGERRAARRAAWLALLLPLPYLLAAFFPFAAQRWVQIALLALCYGGLGFLLIPLGNPHPESGEPAARVDERDIIFARMRLRPDTSEYRAYYAMRPENQRVDDQLRARPGLLSPGSRLYDPLAMPAAGASFQVIDHLRSCADGLVTEERLPVSAEEMTPLIKGLTRYWGAHSVGIAELRDYHVYTHIGRGEGPYGAPIELDHRYAIAFTVEMDHRMVSAAPTAATTMESARQYLEAARVALQLAAYIRALGYPARAHIDGNYRVIAPLVAWDAGLGEIGRMGLLMTPDLGPRVRVNVVTTDLPLIPDARRRDPTVLDFCAQCRKCAENCPSRAIPMGDPIPEGDLERWKIDPVACFRYWATVGTDCAVCMRVCPYSHPDTFAHSLVRMSLRWSRPARIVALALDDFFYGRRPPPHGPPDWLPAHPSAKGR